MNLPIIKTFSIFQRYVLNEMRLYFDVLISSLKGDVTFTLTLDFNPEYEDNDPDFDIFEP